LAKAPITEAIIDFRVKLPAAFKIENFSTLREKLSDRYPAVKERRFFEGEFKVEERGEPSTLTKARGIDGYFFTSQDGLNVAQFRVDGFTFNRLYPYTSWELIFPEAWDLWKLYANAAPVEFITRIAVRYINRLNIPLPITDFSEYLTAPPIVPDDIPNKVGSFFTRLVVLDPETGTAANITQALEMSPVPEHVTIILDIDAYKKDDLELDDEELRSLFDKLRDMKNRIFFNSITEKTARLFE
jgi:uncharacterized protein (TIGR04255 family)